MKRPFAIAVVCALTALLARNPSGPRPRGTALAAAPSPHRPTEPSVPVAPKPTAPSVAPSTPRWEPAALRCLGYHRRAQVVRTPKYCPASAVDAVRSWRPDAVVVLGGGMHDSGDPTCATVQRAALAAQLDEALRAEPPAFVLTGDGNDGHARPLDVTEARCVRARIEQSLRSPRVRRRGVLTRELASVSEGAAWALTEAESMCAVLLGRVEPSRREAVLSRVRFETRAATTAQNAHNTRPMLRDGGYARVLVLTSPVAKRFNRGIDLHADRALDAFRTVRRDGVWALASLGCPYLSARGLRTFGRFESTPRGPTHDLEP